MNVEEEVQAAMRELVDRIVKLRAWAGLEEHSVVYGFATGRIDSAGHAFCMTLNSLNGSIPHRKRALSLA
jgi:hypothetical protein